MQSAADEVRPPHWASLREAGLSAGLWFLYGVYRCGGRWLYRLILWPVALYFALTRGVARRASIEYQQRLGVLAPDAGWLTRLWRVTCHVERFADALLDKALAWTGGLDLRGAKFEIDPRFDAAADAGQGGVMVVAHIGNLEVLRALANVRPTVRLKILVHTRHAQRFNRLLARLNPQSAANLLQVTEIDAAAAAELSHCVSRGEYVVIAADRVPVPAAAASGAASGPTTHTLAIPFLGAPAPLPIGPWVLAAALGCPVYWLSCLKHDATYTLRCERLLERVALPRAQRQAALAAAMNLYAQRLEAACRAAPYAWFNFYPFWPAPRREPSMMPSVTVDIVVPFHDLDPVGIVWHGNYAKYLEIARDELMNRLGYGHDAMRTSGYLWPVVEMKLRYLQAARLRQALRVRATIIEHENRLKIAYDILDAASGRRLTRAHTVQVAVRHDTGEMLFETPAVLREKIAAAARPGEKRSAPVAAAQAGARPGSANLRRLVRRHDP